QITALATQVQLDPHFVQLLADFSEQRFNDVFDKARVALNEKMSQEVPAALIATLKEQGTDALVRSPEDLYIYFLRPNIYEQAAQTPGADIKQLSTVTVQKGSVIIGEGQRVDSRVAEELAAMPEVMQEQTFLRLLGIGLVLLIALGICGRYLSVFAPRLFHSPTELLPPRRL